MYKIEINSEKELLINAVYMYFEGEYYKEELLEDYIERIFEEERELRSEMFSWFRSSSVNKLTIEDLKSIKEIIDKYKGE